jgi:hypothetical protein
MPRVHATRGEEVPFTRKPEERTKMISLNVPESVNEYLAQHGKTETILRAVQLDRELGDLLVPLDERIDAFAKAHGLSREGSAAALLAKLVELGLEAYEAKTKPRR